MAGRSMLPIPMDGLDVHPAAAVRGPRLWGYSVMALFVSGFALWGYTAPLAGGAVAPGTIAPDGSVRTVQHLEGGVIEAIFVREGDVVVAGDPLIALRDVAPEAGVRSLLDRQQSRLAEQARLEAERRGETRIVFPDSLRALPEAAAVMEAEQQVLDAKEGMIGAQRRVLRQRIEQLNEQIRGFEAQERSAAAQLGLFEVEIADKLHLFERGLAPKVELLHLQRLSAEVEGSRGEYVAAIARARQQIGEAELELLALDAGRMEAVAVRASQVRGELAEIEQELAARRDVLERTVLTAPIDGVVTGLRTKTVGGVLAAGQPVLHVVPNKEQLVIDVQVTPTDIDIVEPGMQALLHFSALSSRSTPHVYGTVTSVSADTMLDSVSRIPHYLARVEVQREELDRKGLTGLTVGMPVEAILVAEERTLVRYILDPLFDAVRRAGREV